MGVISGGNIIEGAQPRQLTIAGAPSDGTAGTFAGSAPPGVILIDVTNGDQYQNTNTQASPTWVLISDAGVVLPATAAGRAKMAASFHAADAASRAHFATDFFDAATILLKIADDAFAADSATRALFTDGIWTQAKLAAASLDGTVAKVVAAANVIGGIPVVHVFTLTAGANADNDIVLTHKTRIIDAYVVLKGAGVASSVLTVKSGANAISDAIATSGSDTAVVRAATLNDANWEIAAAGTLRATSSGGASQPAMDVYVTGIRVA